MFTGIIEETGTVKSVTATGTGKRVTIGCSGSLDDLNIGASIAVDGCCTTVVAQDARSFTIELMAISLEKTALGTLTAGASVNLERPLKLNGELSGHLVQGHVDGVGHVKRVRAERESYLITVELPDNLSKYVINAGSIAIQGVSLTVADVKDNLATVGIIPHTWKVTNLSSLKAGDPVNIEVDMIGKYIEKLLPDRK